MQPGHVSGTLGRWKCVGGCTEKDTCCNSLNNVYYAQKRKLCDVPNVPGTMESTASHGNCNTTSKMGRDVSIIYMKWLEQNQDDSFVFAFCLLVFGPALSGYEIQFDGSTHFCSISSKFNTNQRICTSSPQQNAAFCQTHDRRSLDDINTHTYAICRHIFAIFM
jgi:hypothetical protein